jgi:uncharacterized membrane protein
MVIFWMMFGMTIVLMLGWILTPTWWREDTAERIVKRRYARGEIDRETYERMLDDLAHGSHAAG